MSVMSPETALLRAKRPEDSSWAAFLRLEKPDLVAHSPEVGVGAPGVSESGRPSNGSSSESWNTPPARESRRSSERDPSSGSGTADV